MKCPASLALLAVLTASAHAQETEAATLLIRGGTVIDGTGAPGRITDVLIQGDRIASLGDLGDVAADRVIDASGRCVTPGFIDTHSHGSPLETPGFENFLAMGATTICLGQDGESPGLRDLTAWMASVDAAEPGPNVALFVGHATVREASGAGLAPDATPDQLARMGELVAEAMEAGCFGLTTGLEYNGGRPASMEELVTVARPVGERGGVVMSHMRTEDDDTIEASIRELLDQCRGGGAAAHVSHIKVVYGHGAARAEEILALLDEAREGGMQVTADIYPYLASHTGIGIVFPDWALPPNDFDEAVATRREDLEAHLRERVTLRNGPEATLFTSGQWTGRTLAEVAEELGKPFEDVLIDDIRPGRASGAYFVMDQELQDRLLVDPHVMICSDGSPGMRHPRGYGTFARIIRDHVRERGLLSLEEAIRKMTSLPAETIDLAGRGRIAPGMAADVLVFDPAAVRDLATFEEPHLLADGFDLVIVNGQIVREGGQFTGVRAGRMLRRVAGD